MSTATAPPNNRQQTAQAAPTKQQSDFDELMKRSVKFTPLAESEPIEISVGMVKNILAVRSKSGREPHFADITKFMMLCKSRGLNPYVGDAYLLGYDNRDGQTQWSLITAIQALRKRAEANPQCDGCRHGVTLLVDGQIVEREGALILDGEKLVGGWSEVYRKDRKYPARASVKFSVYDTGRSRWAKDPGGMISKVAEAAGLREAFPSDLAGLYIRDEFDSDGDTAERSSEPAAKGIAGLKDRLQDAAASTQPAPVHTEEGPDVDADQRTDDSRDGIDEPGSYDEQENCALPTAEERAEMEAAASGRTKQRTAFSENEGVGQ